MFRNVCPQPGLVNNAKEEGIEVELEEEEKLSSGTTTLCLSPLLQLCFAALFLSGIERKRTPIAPLPLPCLLWPRNAPHYHIATCPCVMPFSRYLPATRPPPSKDLLPPLTSLPRFHFLFTFIPTPLSMYAVCTLLELRFQEYMEGAPLAPTGVRTSWE